MILHCCRLRKLKLILLLAVISPIVLASNASATVRASVEYPAAVIVYGGCGGGLPPSYNFAFTAWYGEVEVEYRFDVTIIKAPDWAVGELRSLLDSLYLDLGAPGWAGGYASRLVFRWVPLEPFYEGLTRLSWRVLAAEGVEAWDTVAVICNIDNVSRVYYSLGFDPWSLRFYPMAGAKGFAGWHPLAFYDLSTVPAPHPGYEMPFMGTGVPVNPETEPPFMEGDASQYILGLVRDHLRYHVAGMAVKTPWFNRRLSVEIIVVVYSNETARELLETLSPLEVGALLETLDPWLEYNVTLRLVPAAETPLRLLPVERRGGWNVVRLEDVEPLLERGGCGPGGCVFRFYWLALPGKTYMTSSRWRLNFTGMNLGYTAVAVYPGYGYRVLKSGASHVVAHEAGHGLGLYHPFQLYTPGKGVEARWLMDYAYTVMSYCDPCSHVANGALQYYDARRLAVLHSLSLPGGVEAVEHGLETVFMDNVTGVSSVERLLDARRLAVLGLARRLLGPLAGLAAEITGFAVENG